MGFGSYDEGEQENQEVDASEIETGDNDRTEHDGEINFDSDESTDELIDRLQDIKED
ncbi:MAG: DUF5786 family protein [Halobacteriales archaeon]